MQIRSLFVTLSAVLGASQASATMYDSLKQLPALGCGSGEMMHFTITKPSVEILDSDLAKLPKKIQGTRIDPKGIIGTRLDVCFDAATSRATLKRIIDRIDEQVMVYEVFMADKGEITKIEGLEQALFGDTKALRISGRTKEFSTKGVEIMGIPNAGDVPLAIAFNGYVEDDGELGEFHTATVGELKLGDMFGGQRCDGIGDAPVDFDFTVGTSKFEIEACRYQEAGSTTGYKFTKLTLTDTEKTLPNALRGTAVVLEGEALKANAKVYIAHHNWGDTWNITVPATGARYGLKNGIWDDRQRPVGGPEFTAIYKGGKTVKVSPDGAGFMTWKQAK